MPKEKQLYQAPFQSSAAAVILAAGKSKRMGSAKMLLPWGDTSVLGYIIKQWRALGVKQITVVSGNEEVNFELDRLGVPRENRIFNPEPERGMFSSIQCAATWRGWGELLTHWVIILGDQPQLLPPTLAQLLDFAALNPERICQPLRHSHWRHPVVLPKSVFRQLSSSEAKTLREFLAGCDKSGFECEDPGLDLDIDTPADYQEVLKVFGGTGGTRTRDL